MRFYVRIRDFSPFGNSLLIWLFIFSTFALGLAQRSQQMCANSGRFMQAYCLGDYNCNVGRRIDLTDPTQRQVCIRGWCCAPTTVSKDQVNVFIAQQDRVCTQGTFNVGLPCQTTEDCVRSSGVPRIPFPVLECGGQGYCCTASRYRKPLRSGDICLNGGTAFGQQCQQAADCQRQGLQQQNALNNMGPVCIDKACCTRRDGGGGGGGQFDPLNPLSPIPNNVNPANAPWNNDLCTNGGYFTLKYCSGLVVNECGNLYQMAWTAVCIDGRCCTSAYDNNNNNNNNGGLDDYDRGQSVCQGLRLQYIRRHCGSPINCGFPSTDFSCLSGYCCARFASGNWDAGNSGTGIRPNNPNAICPVNGRFSRFLGQSCGSDADCLPSYDSRTQRRLLSRCIEFWCCAENPYSPNYDQNADGGSPNQLLIPRTSQGFCYDGTSTNRQCFTQKDCRPQESCTNNMCCQGMDQDQYACGGLQSIGRCTSNNQCPRGVCVSASLCCECQYGQPQKDINNCGNGAVCQQGYRCNNRTGFCCPQCPGNALPYGSCYLGRCAPGFSCRPGNICCEGSPNELPIDFGTGYN